ncbi:uncharacterized protein LOC111365553 [Olea europaea var. sylvestris]|uniref:uncharacterized protein LOC111365553 n=1 Tax=Olea europaea var. sylvestris TaxID=158386 RepID=UPI000C1D6B14|nr:uncharacterized protein LOC111365553 [Olea europaea var. sylvestris]
MITIGISSSQNGSNNVVSPVAIPLHNTIIPHGGKSKKFAGVDFKRWQQKMLFYLSTLNLAKFLKETAPTVQERENNRESIIALDTWKHSDFLCKNYILNGFDNTLYGVYSSKESAKKLWDSLETKYETEDAGTKKFIVSKFLDYKMVDSKIVISQVQEIQVSLHDIHAEKMELKPKATNKKRKANNYAPQRDNSKKAKKFKGNCYNCDKAGHRSSECRKPKKNAQAHIVANNTLSDGLREMSLSAIKNTSSNKRTYETINGTLNEEESRRRKRARTFKTFDPYFLTYMVEDDSNTFDEAMSTPKAPHWKEAINNEIDSIMQNHT